MAEVRGFRAVIAALAVLGVLGVIGIAGCAGGTGAAGPTDAASSALSSAKLDPSEALARRVFEASGGEALGRVAQLDFTWNVARGDRSVMSVEHRWDRRNQRARVAWCDDQGRPIVAVVDLGDRSGRVGRGGEPVVDEEQRRALLDDAHARWINDAYWLVMPLKVLDPCVVRQKVEPRQKDGVTYEILKLSFDGVGLTPCDQYWLWIDPQTGLVRYWEMLLEGRRDQPPVTIAWEDYQPLGPLHLARERRAVDAPLRIYFTDLAARAEVRPEDFTK